MIARTPVAPPAELAERVTGALGRPAVDWLRPHTGLSPAHRFVVRLQDGSGAFVKAATDAETARQLRLEHEILSHLPEDFVPRCLAWSDDAAWPLLVVEDLSAAYWPADVFPLAWREGQTDLLLATLHRVATTAPLASLPRAETSFTALWPQIARDAESFLALGACREDWFRAALDALMAAEASVPLAGDALVHNDVRSDNVCFLGERVVLVDWGSALRGHPEHDLAAWLTTLPLEGGPDPYDVLPGGGAWAAYHAARSARRASLARAAGGAASEPPWLVRVLVRITVICLAWASRALDLPPWTGPHWREVR